MFIRIIPSNPGESHVMIPFNRIIGIFPEESTDTFSCAVLCYITTDAVGFDTASQMVVQQYVSESYHKLFDILSGVDSCDGNVITLHTKPAPRDDEESRESSQGSNHLGAIKKIERLSNAEVCLCGGHPWVWHDSRSMDTSGAGYFVTCKNPHCESRGPIRRMPEDAKAAWRDMVTLTKRLERSSSPALDFLDIVANLNTLTFEEILSISRKQARSSSS